MAFFRPQGGSIARFSPQGGGLLQGFRRKVLTGIPGINPNAIENLILFRIIHILQPNAVYNPVVLTTLRPPVHFPSSGKTFLELQDFGLRGVRVLGFRERSVRKRRKNRRFRQS